MNDIEKKVVVDLINSEEFYMISSMFTKHPFIEVDPENMEDQIFVFSDLDKIVEVEKRLRKAKYSIMRVKVENKDMKLFFMNCHAYGVTQVCIYTKEEDIKIGLSEIISAPDFSHLPEEQRPILNPALQCSVTYFLQEFSRSIPEEQKDNLRALEEEMAVNIARANFLVPIKAQNPEEMVPGEKIDKQTFGIVFVNNPQKQGEAMLPIFSDVAEFEFFNSKHELNAITMKIDKIRELIKGNVVGCVLNPTSLAFRLMPNTLDHIIKGTK